MYGGSNSNSTMLRGRFANTEQVSPAESAVDLDGHKTEKKDGFAVDNGPGISLEHGQLQELEVDITEAIKDLEVEDYDFDRSHRCVQLYQTSTIQKSQSICFACGSCRLITPLLQRLCLYSCRI